MKKQEVDGRELARHHGIVTTPKRLFIGYFPEGVVYADTHVVRNNDYRRIAFLSYRTLRMEWDVLKVPRELLFDIERHAASLRAHSGEELEITSSGQKVRLGGER